MKDSDRCLPSLTTASTSLPTARSSAPAISASSVTPTPPQAGTTPWPCPASSSAARDGRTNFEPGPVLFDRNQRHAALLLRDDILYVFYSRAGDCPEHILCATVDLRPEWKEWKASLPFSILEPEIDYEGVNLPLEPSQRGAIHEPARQLRDPGIYQEGDQIYLLYSTAGESGIALAELRIN